MKSLPDILQRTIRMGGTPQLVGPTFVARWNGQSTKELSKWFPGRFDGALPREQQMELMAYILKMNGVMPGQTPLTMETDVPMVFRATK